MKKTNKRILYTITFLLLVVMGFVVFFNRAPERETPQGNTVVSPANGKIIGIETATGSEFSFLKKGYKNSISLENMESPYKVILIEMNLKNVHVQRAPIDGEIIYQEHFDGAHKNALSKKNNSNLININEKNIVIIKNDDISVGIVQVAGAAARRIQSFVLENNILSKGSIYGRILLGSQVVLILPDTINVLVHEGDVLIDGETIVAEY